MSAATTEYNSTERAGEVISIPVAAAKKLYAGTIIAEDASGNAVNASDTANLKVLGRAQETIDNSGGSAGDLSIRVKRGCFYFANSSGSPVTAAYKGKKVYIEDDHTVSISAGTNGIVAGRCIDIDAGGVWVDTKVAPGGAVAAATASAVVTTGSTNSSPYGYTQAQADAIVAQGNANRADIAAIIAYLKL